MMENSVFHRSAVADELTHFVEARLHVDAPTEESAALARLHEEMNQTTARPYFVVVDPATRRPIARFGRSLRWDEDPQVFIDFLRKARSAG